MEIIKEKWGTAINTLTIGATKEEGGTRTSKVTVGGETTLPFLHFEGEIPYKPVIAMEVLDLIPQEWPKTLEEHFKDVWHDPALWAKKCVEEYKAELICLKLLSAHPDEGNTGAKEAKETVRKVLDKVGVPLIILGPGVHDKDNEVLAAASEETRGEKCLIGDALQDNYKTLVASALADGHSIITESPIDINIAKQVNILVSEMGIPLERLVIYPTTGGLGYGIEYAYSIMERSRLAAFMGDKTLACPILCIIGQETWRAKESKSENPLWGAVEERGPIWEASTAGAFLQAGADILVMRHPKAAEITRKTIQDLMKKNN
ncbi:MAG: acetyl-CoA decarbonylase/synthase complex subunit delta [Armatimonadetes bacterium]|nr:acetyl-CoA decarbonylase/synthase complex subunit delta [Armatimonadota bacterium]